VGSAILAAHLANPSPALAIIGGSTSDPGTFPWANVGDYGVGSTVFLGDVNNNGTFWAITAYHNYEVVNTTVLFGSTYNIVAGSEVRLTNTIPGFSEYTDLMMFRVDVNANPIGLTTITLADTLPVTNNTLYMAGYGGGSKRWASNSAATSPGAYQVGSAFGDIAAFVTYQANGAQAEGGDSGGGVFHFNESESTWELTGIMLGVGPVGGPYDRTYSASIAAYRDQIFAAAIPEPGSMVLLAAGLAGVLWHGKRRRAA
jgi:hypothetical protein